MREIDVGSGRKVRLRFWFLGWWGNAFLPTDLGLDTWCWAKIRPRWFWWLRHVKLFALILWRRYETTRLDWRTAWDISGPASGLSWPKGDAK